MKGSPYDTPDRVMPVPRSILVLGAGELGTAIIKGLMNHPFRPLPSAETKLTVVFRPSTLRSPNDEKEAFITFLETKQVSIIPQDLAASSHNDLVALFSEYDTVISCTGFSAGKGIQLKLANAALWAGISWFLPWQFGVDYDVIGRGSAQDLFDEQCDVRDLLRSQNRTNWTVVSTGMFMSFLFEDFFGVVDRSAGEDGEVVVRALGSWENRVTVTTAEDIGKLTAAVVVGTGGQKGVVHVAGDTVEYSRLPYYVEMMLGREVKKEVWSVDFLREELSKDPENNIKKYRVVFAEGKGVAWDLGTDWFPSEVDHLTNVERYTLGGDSDDSVFVDNDSDDHDSDV
ncbi:MAG: hypothetical protein M1835_007162 [Candelina submexicana]|nr:MAG: hypothetical protein M1835_007162 [Candelina submexicana]